MPSLDVNLQLQSWVVRVHCSTRLTVPAAHRAASPKPASLERSFRLQFDSNAAVEDAALKQDGRTQAGERAVLLSQRDSGVGGGGARE